MATPEAGPPEERAPSALSHGTSAHDPAAPELDDEVLALRRLGEADELVRAGLAAPVDGVLHVTLDDAVAVELPLPPAPTAPVLVLTAAAGDPPFTPEDVQTLTTTVADALLPGTLEMVPDETTLRFIWRPAGANAHAEASRRARALAEHLTVARTQARSEHGWAGAVGALSATLSEHRRRAGRLAATFRDHALVRLPGIGVMHLLAHRTDPSAGDAPRLVVLQRDADLLAPAAGRGLYVALRLPEWGPAGRLARLADGLAALLERRLQLPAQRSEALEMLGEWAEPRHTLLLTLREQPGRRFDDFLWQLADLVRFAESIVYWVTRGHSPFELLDLEDPGADAVDVVPVAQPAAPPPPAPTRRPVAVAPPPVVPDTPEPPIPAPPAPSRPPADPDASLEATTEEGDKGPTAWGVPMPQPRRQGRRVDPIDQMTAREVVKKLGMQEQADVDVFLSHPGYNPQKTIDIMALAIGIDKDEARRIVDSAPGLIVGPVTRSRAVRAKTILEGTGCTVEIIPAGQAGGAADAPDVD